MTRLTKYSEFPMVFIIHWTRHNSFPALQCVCPRNTSLSVNPFGTFWVKRLGKNTNSVFLWWSVTTGATALTTFDVRGELSLHLDTIKGKELLKQAYASHP